jgi:tetratricopeptide (TPR) repeat protein
MTNDLNPDSVPHAEGDALTLAFEELVEGRASRPWQTSPADCAGEPCATENCPEPGDWVLLLSGEPRPAEVDRLLAHAADCAQCADHLHLLQADASAEEVEELSQLPSASPEWQHHLASQLARTPRQKAILNWPQRYLWVGVGLAAAFVLAITASLWWRQANKPETLMAEAYSHSRIYDLRMPGAAFAEVTPVTHLRGNVTGHESPKLREARTRIALRLQNAPDDPYWLELQARADLLEERFDPAIGILDRLLASQPVTSGLLLDDAAAYFQRGAATGIQTDRDTALEYLRRADELAPGDPVVLFNEAVVMEDRGQAINAVETWNRFLKFERDPRWLAEGRRRLQILELKLDQLKTHSSLR